MAAMMTQRRVERLIDRLPRVRGIYAEDAPLGGMTWFRVGGNAEILFEPADIDDLAHFLAQRPADVALTVIGLGSNLLVRDGGVEGVVIHLGHGFADIATNGTRLAVGAGAVDLKVALAAAQAGIAGLEFLSGIPGTIGGGLRMNAGAFGGEMKDVTESALALDAVGNRHNLSVRDLGFGYRHCAVADDWIFVGATLQGHHGLTIDIQNRISEIRVQREASQPLRVRTGGSTFKNPSRLAGTGASPKAWELIDRAGCRGLQLGGAMVSEKHCNFFVNTGQATAADIEALGDEVRRRVREAAGVELEWEIRRVGVALARPEGEQ